MTALKTLPKSVIALGFVSLFMDISSEMIHGLLPIFLVSVLAASATTIGFIEGIGEGLTLITKLFSGTLSDWFGKRKIFIVSGYLLATLSKPLFAIASSIGLVFVARSLDRVGKGLRGAPRDALIADLVRSEQRGSAYGLRQSMDSLGAVIGPLIAVALMSLTGDNYRAIFWLAAIPGFIAVALVLFFVHETAARFSKPVELSLQRGELLQLGKLYWMILGIGVIFTLARFSEVFLLLRASNLGLAPAYVPFILVLMSLAYALGAYPAGRLTDYLPKHQPDNIGKSALLIAGLLVLIVADLVLALANSVFMVAIGALLWGLHLALTQGLFATLLADACKPSLRGTAFGLYGLATGIAVIIASVIAGLLWDQFGAAVTFYSGAGFSSAALVGIVILHRQQKINFKV